MASKNVDDMGLWEKELESLQKDMDEESQSGQDHNPENDSLSTTQETAEENAAFALFDEFLSEQDQGKVSSSTEAQVIKKILKTLEQVQNEVSYLRNKKDSEKESRQKILQKNIEALEKQESELERKIKALKKELSELNPDDRS